MAELNPVIRYGFVVRTVELRTLKLITTATLLLLIIDVFYSCKLFVSAIQIRSHLGYFIDMVASGEGDTLPSLQAVPVLFFLLVNIAMLAFTYLTFDNIQRPALNALMFVAALMGFVLLIIVLIIIICVISHAYSTHQSLHDGIVTAMNHYLNNTAHKSQIDRLQIEFQCCGSKKYDEWYTIKWFDASLDGGGSAMADGNTPFSCCSMKALMPCVHHDIEVTGKAYLYTPEYNLSISTRGCYEIIREKKQKIGWGIVRSLLLYWVFQVFTVAFFRFLQTGHSGQGQFETDPRLYTIWLFGYYVGKAKPTPPKPPPIPNELKN